MFYAIVIDTFGQVNRFHSKKHYDWFMRTFGDMVKLVARVKRSAGEIPVSEALWNE
jgi:hypothetical protein